MNKQVIFALVAINFIASTESDEVLGCGGFLKSHVPIDFSKVEVQLITKQGIVKDKTSAAPNNGYYFLPLYDKGDMILELSPPPGWSFEPTRVALSIDGTSDLCSQGKDINFVFQGFGITGRVESMGSEGVSGPEGVIVQLDSSGDRRSTTTDKNGNFFFTPVFPGSYKVAISHPKWKILKKSVDVKVAESNAELPKNSLVIGGYDVSGMVRSEGQPVKGAFVILYSSKNQNVPVEGCISGPLKDYPTKNNYLCYVITNENGKFTFESLPNNRYYIVPFYKGQNIYFQPEKIDFVVNHDSLELQQSFEIVGFSITGRVLRSSNVPISNVKMFLNGQEIGKTDSSGNYKLEKLKAGAYKIRAEAEDLIFEEVLVQINPSSPELPNIIPSAFKVCGMVTSDHSQIVTFTKFGSTKFIQTETSNIDGSFCQYLLPGKYDVQVVVDEEEKQSGIQFFPLKQTIEVTSEKISNIMFSQLKSTISGRVICLQQEECEGITVVLKTGNENEVLVKIKDGSFTVSDMHPGNYEISLLSNKYCWETSKQTVVVDAAIIEVPPFIQKGYILNFISSHHTKVNVKNKGLPSISFEIPKGRSSRCLEKPGEYNFEMESCHSYMPKTISYKTDSESNEILLSAHKHTLKLSIEAASDFGKLQVSVKIGTDKTERHLSYRNGVYELDILLEPRETAVVVPQSDVLFFSPPILSVDGRDDCVDLGVQFVTTRGKIFEGKIIPPLPGVTVTVESSDTESLVIETDSSGVFKFPPLDSKKDYTITAKKESFVLTGPDASGNFMAHKLAEIIVEIVDGSDNIPLSGVLLSLSGDENYRKNLQSGENGQISFNSLSPMEYFLRPMMKEYQFEPKSMTIPVQEGQTVNVKLLAKRVAFSAFGQVVSLNGEPEDNMVIVASGVGNCSQYSEETTCESTGQFRIRGLQPYCSYRVVVKGSLNEDYIVERTAPEYIKIDAIKADVRDLRLIIFRPASQMDILVRIYAENIDHYKSLKLKLARESGSSAVIQTVKVDSLSLRLTKAINPGILVHLSSVPIDNKLYTVQLESSFLQSTKYQPQLYHFGANESFKLIEFHVSVKDNISEQPIKRTSIWSLLFIFAVLCAAYNIEVVGSFLKEKFNFNISALTNLIPKISSNDKTLNDDYYDAQIDQIVQSINNAKKKPKPKKI
ncbi:unnamed protein product [Phaedon cochleariae]|uniref:Nodal modulator 1 n=1 Tax=Phaedon cochleariae TaxID=80249 RepID=A0A9P0DP51_PHACE|nr:unnamed protein product [Phaedon cochleariae]